MFKTTLKIISISALLFLPTFAFALGDFSPKEIASLSTVMTASGGEFGPQQGHWMYSPKNNFTLPIQGIDGGINGQTFENGFCQGDCTVFPFDVNFLGFFTGADVGEWRAVFMSNFVTTGNCTVLTLAQCKALPDYLGVDIRFYLGTDSFPIPPIIGLVFVSTSVVNDTPSTLGANVQSSTSSLFPVMLISIGVFFAFYILQKIMFLFPIKQEINTKKRKRK